MKIKALCKIRTDIDTVYNVEEVFEIENEEGKRLVALLKAEEVVEKGKK